MQYLQLWQGKVRSLGRTNNNCYLVLLSHKVIYKKSCRKSCKTLVCHPWKINFANNRKFCKQQKKKKYVPGWVGGWMVGKAVLRIASSNQKLGRVPFWTMWNDILNWIHLPTKFTFTNNLLQSSCPAKNCCIESALVLFKDK